MTYKWINNKNYKHWMCWTRLYGIWSNLKQRCNNNAKKEYNRYWWRWITYDPKWEKFEWFYEDMKNWYSDNLTIDRIDNDWNYCKENCRWETVYNQVRNRCDNIFYKWKCVTDWCIDLWINKQTYNSRINKLWWTIEEALWITNKCKWNKSKSIVYQYTLKWTYINTFESVSNAAIKLWIHRSWIQWCIDWRYKHSGWYIWKLKK